MSKKDEDDLTPATDENRSLDDLKQSWIAKANTPCIFLSAKRRTNIDKFRQDLYGMVREIHAGRYPVQQFPLLTTEILHPRIMDVAIF